jgi:hypothetical protein
VDLFLCWEKDAWVFLQAVQNSCNNFQLLDEVEQNIVICRWRADQLFADAEGIRVQ